MPKIRNQDSGLVAPKTGCVRPVGVERLRWELMCYTCGTITSGDTRKEAIEGHRSHWDIDHAEDPE